MADPKQTFEVSIPFIVEKVVDGELKPYFDCSLVYHDLPYAGVVAIEAAMITLLKTLNQYGVDTAEAMGQGDTLKNLNVAQE
uniref:Uncharacterized protein n=1 Tax=viral metagenome TaxID=1070528 RepID=A0A6M3LFG4_9ZZZZ